MANPLKGEVSFTADGVAYTLVFTTNAIIALEDKISLPISRIGELLANIGAREMRTMFWAALLDRHGVTEDEAGAIMDAVGGIVPASELVTDALVKAMPQEEARGTARPRKPAVGIGKGS